MNELCTNVGRNLPMAWMDVEIKHLRGYDGYFIKEIIDFNSNGIMHRVAMFKTSTKKCGFSGDIIKHKEV